LTSFLGIQDTILSVEKHVRASNIQKVRNYIVRQMWARTIGYGFKTAANEGAVESNHPSDRTLRLERKSTVSRYSA